MEPWGKDYSGQLEGLFFLLFSAVFCIVTAFEREKKREEMTSRRAKRRGYDYVVERGKQRKYVGTMATQ